MFFHKLTAFLKRDLIENLSYKTQFVFDAAATLTQIFIFFYIAKLVTQSELPALEAYRGGFFSFVLLGITLAAYHSAALETFARGIYREQGAGTLEAIVLSPTSLQTVVLSGSLWSSLFITLRLFIYLSIGFIFFQAEFSKINFFSAAVTLFLSLLSLSGLGMISAGLVLILKRADPLSYLLNGLSRLISGVYFPASLLPAGVKFLSLLLPLTYSLEAMRKSVLLGAGPETLWREWLMLGVFSVLFIPAGVVFFHSALNKVRRDGTLHLS